MGNCCGRRRYDDTVYPGTPESPPYVSRQCYMSTADATVSNPVARRAPVHRYRTQSGYVLEASTPELPATVCSSPVDL